MKIDIKNCAGMGVGLLADMANFKTVDKYLRAVLDVMTFKKEFRSPGTPEFVPIDCAVVDTITGDYRWFVLSGRVTDKAEKNFKWLQSQPDLFRNFMSDYISIIGDAYERELFILWE